MDKKVGFSVVIPTYNGVVRLRNTLQSVLDQTFPAHEIIVVDDGSTDDTSAIPTEFAGRIHFVRTANGGQQRARNHGVSLATGTWVAMLDHDDLWEPNYLAEAHALIQANDVDVVIANSRTWEEHPDGGTWKCDDRFLQFAPAGYWDVIGASPSDRWSILDRYDYASYLRFHPAQTSMFIIRRDFYLELGGYDERMRGLGAENFEFEIRLLRRGRVGLIWQPMVKMLLHDTNAGKSPASSQMALDIIAALQLAVKDHQLTASELAIVDAEVQRRLPSAIYGAFLTGQYPAIRESYRAYRGTLPWKARLKVAIAHLPAPVARRLGSLLRG